MTDLIKKPNKDCTYCEGTGNDWPPGCDYCGPCPICYPTIPSYKKTNSEPKPLNVSRQEPVFSSETPN